MTMILSEFKNPVSRPHAFAYLYTTSYLNRNKNIGPARVFNLGTSIWDASPAI